MSGGELVHLPTVARDVFDVTGAGDTVVSVLAVALAAGASMVEAAVIANHAAGLVIREVGTASVGLDAIERSFLDEREGEHVG
jgi:D-beta-D-heptose 7-phosphate kinase/D-beta-D-heptose 1-phosphate adenosyltransferase